MAERLELTGPAFTSRAVSFMNLMRVPAFRKSFAADPAGTAMREFQLKVPAATLTRANRLFAMLIEDKAFAKWCQEFQTQVEAKYPKLTAATSIPQLAKDARAATASIRREFAEGVAAHLPPEFVRKIGLKNWRGQIVQDDDNVALILLVFIALVVVVVLAFPRPQREPMPSRNTVRLLINQLEALKMDPSGKGQ